jgi:membrane protease YdiL (CAAX protease family)
LPFTSHIPLYLTLLAFELALVLLVVRLAKGGGLSVSQLIGERWAGPLDIVRDLTIAAAMWGVWATFLRLAHSWLPQRSPTVVSSMLPVGPFEAVLWILLSISAGFAEELAFRGYLQRKLGSLAGSVTVGIVGQAVLFGMIHGYQGAMSVVRIVGFGGLFGVVAHWRKSLRPGMIAHAWTDIAAGLLRW